MDRFMKTAAFSCILIISLFSTPSYAQNCNSYSFTNRTSFTTCRSLPVLNSFLHWNYHQANHTVDIAYRHGGISTSQWVAWALNDGGSGMIGSQALVAFTNSTGVRAYTSAVSGYGTSLAPSSLSFGVPRIEAEYSNNEMIIYATLQLPTGRTSFTQVWQEGPMSGGSPAQHALSNANRNSVGIVDFSTGQTAAGGGVGGSRVRRSNIHGVLNVVGWGILLPIGAMSARYLKVFKSADPAWFYIHVITQCSGYIVGVAGWATGLKLGSDSVGIQHDVHRNIGITLFCLGTVQVFALLLRPKKDHKLRIYWNIYHYAVGYTVIILSIVNIFRGFNILNPAEGWRRAYIGVLIFLGFNAVMLEVFTWYVVIKRKKSNDSDKYPHVGNGTNGVNGYGATRSPQDV